MILRLPNSQYAGIWIEVIFSAIATLIEYQVIGDLNRIYDVTRRDGTDFNLACIPEFFKVPHTMRSDTVYMRQLFEFGREQALSGYKWAKEPPRLRVTTKTTVRRNLAVQVPGETAEIE